MKGRLYHLCFTSHQEVICRNHSDYVRLFNCLAQAIINSNSQLIACNIMSNHLHMAVITDNTGRLIQRIRSSYTQMFNDIYRRIGMLGDPKYFSLLLVGRIHISAALSYILRNPVHHNVCANPFAYPYSPIQLYFNNHRKSSAKADMGLSFARSKKTIREKNAVPYDICFDVHGMIDMASVVSTDILEGYFGSYRAFQYGLTRNDYDRWQEEQEKEHHNTDPITLLSIEPHISSETIGKMTNQNLSWIRENEVTDLELCAMIDNFFLSDFHKNSYTELTDSDKIKIARKIQENMRISPWQLGRCLNVRPEILM